MWRNKGLVVGTAEKSHLNLEVGDREHSELCLLKPQSPHLETSSRKAVFLILP